MAKSARKSHAALVAPVRKTFITEPAGLKFAQLRNEYWLDDGDIAQPPEPQSDAEKATKTDDGADDEVIDATDAIETTEQAAQTPYLIIGFDIEYTSPVLTKSQVKKGDLTPLKIHSYQFSACTHDGVAWTGIFLPPQDERYAFSDFLVFVYAVGARRHGFKGIPSKLFLVGHNLKLTLPLFTDFTLFSHCLSINHGTVASGPAPFFVDMTLSTGEIRMVEVQIRDTLMLVSQTAKRIKDVAALVGIEEVELPEARGEFFEGKSRIEQLLHTDWNLYCRYALNDAEICMKYLQRIIALTVHDEGKFNVPLTLASIGISLLRGFWADLFKAGGTLEGKTEFDLLGTETVKTQVFHSGFGHSITKPVVIRKELFHIYEALITECYQGGRAEQNWFGPSIEATWSDYDLTSAYPTAMSHIGLPNWDAMHNSNETADYQLDKLGFAVVDFEFPEDVRYPTLPVRAADAVIFPRRGRSYCGAPEIHLALRLKADVKIVTGILIPHEIGKPVFRDFVSHCADKRTQAGEGTLDAAFWKEISNTLYGKTAQGLKERRVYDMKDQAAKQMPRSPITNAAFAAYITSFTRAVLGESMNAIPKSRSVFSCTTDGFITDATEEEMSAINRKRLFNIVYGGLREEATNDAAVMKKKHEVKKLIGWRARGQATLVEGQTSATKTMVLAKASIYTAPEFDTLPAQNGFITDTFFRRHSKSKIQVLRAASMKRLQQYGGEPRSMLGDQDLNMEYDWKRKPVRVHVDTSSSHVAFDTEPWEDVAQYNRVQDAWDQYQSGDGRKVIKSIEDLHLWFGYLCTHTLNDKDLGKYWNTDPEVDSEIDRLRTMLCRAFKAGAAGVEFTEKVKSQRFAELLASAGVDCKVYDINNSLKKPYAAHQCLPSATVLQALESLKVQIPTLNASDLLYDLAADKKAVDLRHLTQGLVGPLKKRGQKPKKNPAEAGLN